MHCGWAEIQPCMTNLDYRAEIHREIQLRCDSDIYLQGGGGCARQQGILDEFKMGLLIAEVR